MGLSLHYKKRLTYCYPVKKNVSFSLIARNHIRYGLGERYYVFHVDVDNLRFLRLLPTNYVLLHPLFYPFYYCWYNDRELQYQLAKIRSTRCDKIVALDTADSDRISDRAVMIANYLPDVIIVPSEYSRKAYIDSGVKKPIHVLPHGVSDVFFTDIFVIKDHQLLFIYKKAKNEGKKIMLFFCLHSEYRKGADIVHKAINILRKERNDFILLCKFSTHNQPYIDMCDYIITKFMNDDELKTLYDISDIVLVPSRGGGFELNGLEALIRDRPIVYPEGSCIEEYAKRIVPELAVKVAFKPIVLPNNPIHVGRGHEVDLDDFIGKIRYVLDNVEELKLKIRERFKEKHQFRWVEIVGKLINILER